MAVSSIDFEETEEKDRGMFNYTISFVQKCNTRGQRYLPPHSLKITERGILGGFPSSCSLAVLKDISICHINISWLTCFVMAFIVLAI